MILGKLVYAVRLQLLSVGIIFVLCFRKCLQQTLQNGEKWDTDPGIVCLGRPGTLQRTQNINCMCTIARDGPVARKRVE